MTCVGWIPRHVLGKKEHHVKYKYYNKQSTIGEIQNCNQRETREERRSDWVNPQMEALGNNICFGSSLFITPAAENVLLNKKNNFFSYNHVLVSKNSSPRLRKICCGLSDSEIGENPRSRILTKPKINKMDEYNIAMKRMMRNPYEYHHDLGLSLLLLISFQQVLSFTFYWIFQFLFYFFYF